MKKYVLALFLILALGFILAACAAPGGGGGSTVKVGAVYPLSGATASTGEDLKQGVELALEVVNNKHDDLNLPMAKEEGVLKGKKLEVIFADHEGKPDKGKAEAERLITQEKVAALFGSYHSSVTKTASQAAEQAGIPFVNAESTNAQLTERGFKWFFRTTPHDGTFAENAFQFMKDLNDQKGAGLKTVALVYENTDFGKGFANLAKDFASQYGFDIVEEVSYPAKTQSVSAEVQKLKAANPDAVIFVSYVSDAILYMNTMKELGFAPKLVWANDAGFIASGFLENLGKDGEYITSREVWAADLAQARPLVAQVNKLYHDKYGEDMNGNSARAFTGMLVLADAIHRAGSTDPEKIREALKATNIPGDQLIVPWKGIKFDEKGQNELGSGIVVQVLNGKYTTVWPFDLKAADIVFPFPAWDAR